MTKHDKLLRRYILSDRHPHGNWHVNVPSGMQIAEQQVANSDTTEFSEGSFAEFAMNRAKEIDAICIQSETDNRELGWSAWDRDNIEYYEQDVFDGEQIILIEFKTSNKEIYKGLGQLEMYSTHIRQYWNCNWVAKVLVLLGDEMGEFTQAVEDDLDTRVVAIPNVRDI